MDYWIARLRKEITARRAGLMDCCKSKNYAGKSQWEKSKTSISKFFFLALLL
jgi:hypothetical protein